MSKIGSDIIRSTAVHAFRTGNVEKLDRLLERIRLTTLVGKRGVPDAWRTLQDLFPDENIWFLSKDGLCLEYLSALYFQFPEIPKEDMIRAIELFHTLGDYSTISRLYLLHEDTIVNALSQLNKNDI